MSRRPAKTTIAALTAVCLLASAALSGSARSETDDGTAVFHGGVAAHEGTGARIVVPGHDGARVMFREVTDPPGADTMPFAERIGVPVDITPPADVTTAEVRLAFDPDRELPAAAAGGERPTIANTFIAVYDDHLRAWLPLETTFDDRSNEMVATTPHFSEFGLYSVLPGQWSLPNPLADATATLGAIRSGLSATVDVVYDTTTSGLKALQEHVLKPLAGYAGHMWQDATGAYPDGKHVDCGAGRGPDGSAIKGASSGASAVAVRWQAATTGELAGKLRVCVVADPAGPEPVFWLRLENHLGAPLHLFPPRASNLPPQAAFVSVMWNDYDIAMIDDPLLLLQRFFSAAGAFSIVAGASGSELEITDTRSAFTINAAVNWLAVTLDLTMLLLSMLAPATRAWAKETLDWQHAATRKIPRDSRNRPARTLTPEDLAPWRQASDAGQLIDLYNCVKGAFEAVKEPSAADALDMARQCISTVFDAAVAGVAGAVLANLKVAPEVRDLFRHGNETATITVRPPITDNQLKRVDWEKVAGPLLLCGELEPDLRRVDYHDISGDGVPDSFVRMDCATGDDRYPNTILVYDGASSAARPRMLDALLVAEDDVYLNRGGCLQFDGSRVTLRGRTYRDTDPAGDPTLLVTQTSTWNGSKLVRGYKNVSQALPKDLEIYPGCS